MAGIRRQVQVWVAAVCVVAIVLGQTVLLQGQAVAQEVGRPPLPPGIVRLPFNGEVEITQVPGCGQHTWNDGLEKRFNETNVRAFDFGLFAGSEVLAAGDGDVIDIFNDPGGSLTVVIDHRTDVRSYYVHLQESWVSVGDSVFAGDVIALSGESGAPGQPHLHFAVTEGGDPATTGVAANVNSLPGIPWAQEQLNEEGFAICNPNAHDYAVGGAVAPEPQDPPQDDGGMITAITYDRNAAVQTAVTLLDAEYVQDNDSATYVSNVLWGGGLPQTDDWQGGAIANPQDLVNYLISPHQVDESTSIQPGEQIQLDWSDNNAADAELGDVIAYDWEGDGYIDHVAVVTNINGDGFPEVSEHSPTWLNRYWTYSETEGAFIADAFPGSVAYLIRILPITMPNF